MARAEGGLGAFNSYALLIVLACACYGMNLNYLKFKIPALAPMTIISVSLLLIAPLAYVYLFGFTEFTYKLAHAEGAWRALGFIGILALMSTAVANLLFYKLLRISSPLFASSVTYVMPLVSVMWGVIDGEVLLVGHFIGMAHNPNADATMYASYAPGTMGPRHLSDDDRAGACVVYPPGRIGACDPTPRGGVGATCNDPSKKACAVSPEPAGGEVGAMGGIALVALWGRRRRRDRG